MEMVQSMYFCFGAKLANSKFASKTAKLSEEAKKIENFPKFQRYMEKTNTFKCKPPEVHFTIRNRVPYHKLLTNLACSNRTGNYYTTQAVRGPITKINQSKCSITGPIFSKYWTGHCPE